MRHAALAAAAVQSLRQSPLRTVLSVLGLVIGVAALVAILSMIDGMERYAREQVEATTPLQTVVVAPRTSRVVDGVPVARDDVPALTPADARALGADLGAAATVALAQRRTAAVAADTVRTAAEVTATEPGAGRWPTFGVGEGRSLGARDSAAVVVSASLAARIAGDGRPALGRTVTVGGVRAEVVGVLAGGADDPHRAVGPYVAFGDPAAPPPTLAVHVEDAAAVGAVTGRVRGWLDGRFAPGAFEVVSYEGQAEQLREGMLLFKLVMGLITGVSVVVGGVGVMNVLLVTVTERTREIGVRKAAGARRRDVVVQFLAEAVVVSGVGSALGLALGLAVVFAAAPVLRHLTGAPFYAVVTGGTLAVVGVLAVVVGVVFGTYPALRAARLSPVEAMRRE